jgi:predicted nucleic acid-binding protein
VVSCLARVEVPAAIWRKSRIGELDSPDAALLVSEFEADCGGNLEDLPRFLVVAIVDDVVSDAAQLTATRALRAYDAVQLATARAARTADPSCSSLACFDHDLREAAARDGFGLIPA